MIEFTAIIVQTICGILVLIYPNDVLLIQLAFAFEGIYFFFLVTSIGYQVLRVVKVLESQTFENSTERTPRYNEYAELLLPLDWIYRFSD